MNNEQIKAMKAMQVANKNMMTAAEKLYLQTHPQKPLPYMFVAQAS